MNRYLFCFIILILPLLGCTERLTNLKEKYEISTIDKIEERSAFPHPRLNANYGLTKREFIATLCLTGYIGHIPETTVQLRAKLAVEEADALIKELNK